jgi:5-epi-alpha-selinene synthase
LSVAEQLGIDEGDHGVYCPFDSDINDAADAVAAFTDEWLRTSGLVEGEGARRRWVAACLTELAARACPDAPVEVLDVVSRWNAWLFVRDDLCDRSDVGRDPDRMQILNEDHLSVLCGRAPGPNRLARALAEIHRALVDMAGDLVRPRWLHAVELYMEGCRWEAVNRRAGRVPVLDEYLALRRWTGGLLPSLELYAALGGISSTPWSRADPLVCELLDVTNDAVCWTNDIFSAERERAAGDVHNLVLVLEHHHRVPTAWARQRALDMIEARVRRFIELEPLVWSVHQAEGEDALAFTHTLRAWLRGNLDWSRRSARYRPLTIEPDNQHTRQGERTCSTSV